MSELTPSVLALDKGLDLQTAKMVTSPGSLLDSLNYEQVDFQGQKRIEGYARYDGSALPAIDEYYVLQLATPTEFVNVGNLLLRRNTVFGVVVELDGENILYVKLNSTIEVTPESTVTIMQTDPNNFYSNDHIVLTNTTGTELQPTAEDHYTKLLEIMGILRLRIGTLPGRIAGLHWLKDRLYSVANTSVAVVPNDLTVYPNDSVMIGDFVYRVFDVYYEGGTQAILVESTEETFAGLDLYKLDETMSWVFVGTVLDAVFYSNIPHPATIFESRTEQQVLSEDDPLAMDFGWRAKHLGWMVTYEDGIALYGALAAVNQNRQGVGIEGPTDTSGTNGSPAILTQNVVITNAPSQVNGWKSFDSPTAYVLDASDVQQIDSTYVYADAFISWATNSTVVSTPGSDMQDLVEYSPTNSVTYESF